MESRTMPSRAVPDVFGGRNWDQVLPVSGDRVTAGNAVFTVREMDGRRIESLAIDLHAAGDRRATVRAEG